MTYSHHDRRRAHRHSATHRAAQRQWWRVAERELRTVAERELRTVFADMVTPPPGPAGQARALPPELTRVDPAIMERSVRW
jgi:hypothetical protein